VGARIPAPAGNARPGPADRDRPRRPDHAVRGIPVSWLLFYVSLLDLRKTPQLEIADPMGLVQSQAVESAGGTRCAFTLNGSLASQSLSSRFIQNYFGAGVQHIAFACPDIFAAADAAIAGGIERLEIPRNYYDDLEARWGLEPELIEAMAARDILYDRATEADGTETEYFQFYTRAFARRVFFELVERRGYARLRRGQRPDPAGRAGPPQTRTLID
jgi:4-hydroxyphenylpyruvate dioxygenase